MECLKTIGFVPAAIAVTGLVATGYLALHNRPTTATAILGIFAFATSMTYGDSVVERYKLLGIRPPEGVAHCETAIFATTLAIAILASIQLVRLSERPH